jgi:glucose/arabinose dehydrogenase
MQNMMDRISLLIIVLFFLFFLSLLTYYDFNANAQLEKNISSEKSQNQEEDQEKSEPWVKDPSLEVQMVSDGLNSPSSIAFLGPNDILVLEKYKGRVHRILDGNLLADPLLDVAVSNKFERGMLGIGTPKNEKEDRPTYVFLYYTESSTQEDGADICPESYYCDPENDPIGNRLYRYELVNNSKLVKPKLLLDLPATPGPTHNGGKVVIGPDENVYITIGDVLGYRNESSSSKVMNFKNGTFADGRSGVLRVTLDGNVVGSGIIGKSHPLNYYYAYGIRNSFGIAFDPITGNLWNTENGPDYGDEINLVEPGFNSGWIEVQGHWKPVYDEIRGGDFISGNEIRDDSEDIFENFGGKGKYSDPEFIWYNPVAPTGLAFLGSDKLGKDYENDMFVGDYRNGNLYHFELNENRTELSLSDPIEDHIANSPDELDEAIFGGGFNAITDVQVGPYDGYLYVLSLGNGALYRVIPSE